MQLSRTKRSSLEYIELKIDTQAPNLPITAKPTLLLEKSSK